MTDVVDRVGARADPPSARRRLLRAPLAVARARLGAHPGRALLVAVGVMASTAMLTATFGGSLVARDRAVQSALAALPASERTFRVDAYGLPEETTYAQADRQMRAILSSLAAGTPVRATFFRELRIRGNLVQLAGLDGLSSFVRLRSGRLPRVCEPARCEVVEIGGAAIGKLDEAGIHLVPVGVGVVPRRALFGSSIDTEQQGGDNPTLLLAAGAQAFERSPAFDGLFRIYTWISPLSPDRVHLWDVGRVLDRETQAQAELARTADEYQLSGPDQALNDARAAGRVAAQRMLLIGGEASTVLLGFALLTAMGLRRGLTAERRRLLQRGARRWQVWLSACAEIATTTLTGAVVGAAVGVAVIAAVARAARLPGGAVLTHSVATLAGLGALGGLWLAAGLIVLAGARVGERETTRRRIGILEVAAVGALGAVGLALARGGLNAQTLQGGGGRGLLLALPLLASFVAAVAAMRLLGPATRVAERVARRAPIAVRLALLALSRAPLRTTATVAFLLVSLGLALFAGAWRGTLGHGARDQAAFAIPLDFKVTEGTRLVLPLEAGPLSRYQAMAPGVHAYPVLRRTADVAGVGTGVLSPTVLGLSPEAVAGLHWRSDFSSESPAALARRIGVGGPVAPNAITLPVGTRAVSLDVALAGIPVRLDLVVRDARGVARTVPIGERPAGSWRLTTRLPRSIRQVYGLQISVASAEQLGLNHRETGGEEASRAAGTARLGQLRAIGADGTVTPVTTWQHGFVAQGGLTVRQGAQPHLSYAFTQGQTMLLRLRQPTDGRILPVVASADVARSAGPGGLVVLDFQDARLTARIVAVVRRFPDAEDQGQGVVVADESRLATALDADAPATGTPDELWLSAPANETRAVSKALASPPFASLVVASRSALQHTLSIDPLARGVELSLAAAVLAALALAVIGFWLAVVSELRDERGELFDLEAQGVAPQTLRRQFRLRAAGLLAAGVLGGCVLGLFLTRIVVSVVRVAATTAPPDPPLRLDVPWVSVLVGLVALIAGLLGVTEVSTRRAFRGDTPERASWSLE